MPQDKAIGYCNKTWSPIRCTRTVSSGSKVTTPGETETDSRVMNESNINMVKLIIDLKEFNKDSVRVAVENRKMILTAEESVGETTTSHLAPPSADKTGNFRYECTLPDNASMSEMEQVWSEADARLIICIPRKRNSL